LLSDPKAQPGGDEKTFVPALRQAPRSSTGIVRACAPQENPGLTNRPLPGKETVQNILVLPLRQHDLEPIWTANFISKRADHRR